MFQNTKARHYAGERELTWDPVVGNREGYLYGASISYFVQVLISVRQTNITYQTNKYNIIT